MPTLITPAELAPHVDDPEWAIIDCRFELARPEFGAGAWAAGHIPNAQYAHLDRDLSGPRDSASGRHPLPDPAALGSTLGRLGIDATVQVVAYDQGAGAFAARLWWLARWLGHTRVAVLDGGFAAWERAGLPLSTTTTRRAARRFSGRPDPTQLATTAEVAELVAGGALERGERVLVDARGADRFRGENESIDAVAGHVPGARSHPFSRNHDAAGHLLPARELRGAWEETLRGVSATRLIAMCGSGVTACHDLLALEIAGLPGGRLYAGSWSEWIRDPARPVARGPES